jgi:hypothetical protein
MNVAAIEVSGRVAVVCAGYREAHSISKEHSAARTTTIPSR